MATNYRASFVIKGTMPLLMHWDNILGGDELTAWRKDPANKNRSVPGDDRSPPWTWQTYLYRHEGKVAMPSDNLMRSLRNGGTQLIMKKQKTFKELTQTAIFIATEFCEFRYGDENRTLLMKDVDALRELSFAEQAAAVKELGFSLFVKRAPIGNSKHIRVRPRFESWQVLGNLSVESADLPFEKLEEIFGYAGRGGLCDWRPSSKSPGSFGMFTVELKKTK